MISRRRAKGSGPVHVRRRTSSGPEGSSDKVTRAGCRRLPEPFVRRRSSTSMSLPGPRPQVAAAALFRPWSARRRSSPRCATRCARAASRRPTSSRASAASARRPRPACFAKALNCESGPTVDPCNECATCRRDHRAAPTSTCSRSTPRPTRRSSRCASSTESLQVRTGARPLQGGGARRGPPPVARRPSTRCSRSSRSRRRAWSSSSPPPRSTRCRRPSSRAARSSTSAASASAEVGAHLRRDLRDKRAIAATDTRSALLARAGEGSVRDAVALLDQLATFGAGAIAEEEAARLVGGLDTALFDRTARRHPRRQTRAAVAAIARARRGGGLGSAPGLRPLSRLLPGRAPPRARRRRRAVSTCRARRRESARRARAPGRLREPAAPAPPSAAAARPPCAAAKPGRSRSRSPGCAPPSCRSCVRVEELLRGRARPPPPVPPAAAWPAAATDARAPPSRASRPAPRRAPAAPPPAAAAPPPPGIIAAPVQEGPSRRRPHPLRPRRRAPTRSRPFLEERRQRRPPLAAQLQRAAAFALEDGRAAHLRRERRHRLAGALARRQPRGARRRGRRGLRRAAPWRLLAGGEEPPANATRAEPAAAPAARTTAPAAVCSTPTVQTVLEIFGGSAARAQSSGDGGSNEHPEADEAGPADAGADAARARRARGRGDASAAAW